FLTCLGPTVEPGGPRPPVEVSFEPSTFTTRPTPPPTLQKQPLPRPSSSDLVVDEPGWASVTYEQLQERLEAQRNKPTRLRIPPWEEVARNLPEALAKRPSDIIWFRIVFGYAPELAVPYDLFMRTAGAESAPRYDRVFGQSLVWVVTRAIQCPYCM